MAPQQYSPVILPPMYRIAQPDQIVPLTPADMRELFLGPVSKTPTPFEIPHKPTPHQRSEIKDTVQPGECTPDLFEERIESENNGDKDSFPYWCSSTLRGIWVKVKTRADRLLWVRLGVVNQTSPEALATMPEQMQRAFSPEGPQDEPVAFRKTSLISKRQKIFIDSDV